MSAFKLVQRDAEGKHGPFWKWQGSDEMRFQDKSCHSAQNRIQITGKALGGPGSNCHLLSGSSALDLNITGLLMGSQEDIFSVDQKLEVA